MSTLSAGEHDDEVDLVAILDGFDEFIGVGAGMIEIDFNVVKEFIFLCKDGFLHSRKLPDEVVQTFPNRISFYRHHLLAIRKSSMRCMNVYLY